MRRLLLLIVLLAAAPAQAQEISGTVSPDAVVHGRDARVTWRITVKTQAQPANLRLFLSSASRTPDQHGSRGFIPARLRTDEIRLEGPGNLRGGPIMIVDHCSIFMPALPTYGHPAHHGFDPDALGYELEVPANSESVVVVPAETSSHAPWPGTTYALDARVGDMPLDLPRATVGGRTGVPLTIATEPPAAASMCSERPRLPGGTRVKISGRTDPAIAGDRIDLIHVVANGSRPIGPAIVGPDGWFALDGWVPEPGDYTIAARYASQRPDRADDFAHPLWFGVDQPPAPPPPPATRPVAPALLGRAVVRRGFVTVRLNCTAQGGCRGIVRLHRSGRRLAARRYDVAQGVVARARLRLPAAVRRSLRRRGRLAAQVSVTPVGGDAVVHRITLRRR